MPQLPEGLKITWLGHASFLIETPGGKRVLIDPFLTDNPATPDDMKDFDNVDVIAVTHGHFDHTQDVVRLAMKTGATVIGMVELVNWFKSEGVENVVDINKGGTAEVAGVKFHLTHAIHSSTIPHPESDDPVHTGDPAGFVLEFEDGYKLYHSGDTSVFGDMSLIGKLLGPDIALLPIGDHYTMGPRSAAEAIRLLGVKTVVPMHYGTFPLLTGTPDQLREHTGDIEGLEIVEMKPGETIPG